MTLTTKIKIFSRPMCKFVDNFEIHFGFSNHQLPSFSNTTDKKQFDG